MAASRRGLGVALTVGALWLLLPGGVAAQARVADTIGERVKACAACHGKEGRATREGYFPRIAGKPKLYLYNQLINFREGKRQYPVMTYLVAQLSDDYLMEMADYFARQDLPYPPPQQLSVPAATLERGRTLVMQGHASRPLPACVSCHGPRLTGVLPAIPGLAGLPRDYLNAQFGAWKAGTRRAAAPDCMATISKQLSAEDIGAISAWFALLPLPANMAPSPASARTSTLACGSVSP